MSPALPDQTRVVEISRPGAPVSTFVMSVDEEFEMADAVGSLVESG